jgi:hypothetical protein
VISQQWNGWYGFTCQGMDCEGIMSWTGLLTWGEPPTVGCLRKSGKYDIVRDLVYRYINLGILYGILG